MCNIPVRNINFNFIIFYHNVYIKAPYVPLNFFHNIIIMSMTKEEKIKKLDSLRKKASDLKREVDYYNALQLALKLVLNGSYV